MTIKTQQQTVMVFSIVSLVLTIVLLVEVSRTRDEVAEFKRM